MFKTLNNFRDLGGIQLHNGKKTKRNKILRSGELVNLCKEDIDILVYEYNIKTIIDFRSYNEVMQNPDVNFEGIKYCNFQLLGDLKNNSADSSRDGLIKMAKNGNMFGLMKTVYRFLVTSQSALEGYRKFIDECLKNKDGSLIFHCYAGKDRTGVAAAIILTLLGADEDAVFADYMLTNNYFKSKMNKENQESKPYKEVMSVDESYLHSAYKAATKESGSFYNHIVKKLKISDEEISRLKYLYTEPTEL